MKFESKSIDLALIKKAFKELYPKTAQSFDIAQSQKLFSQFQIELPVTYLNKIKTFNQVLHKVYTYKIKNLSAQKLRSPQLEIADFKNQIPVSNILSCLDFHINLENDELRLIEANTNASGYLIGSLVHKIHNLDFKPMQDKLLKMFSESLDSANSNLYVMDEQPEKQKMFIEFLLYQELLSQNGLTLNISDSLDLDQKANALIEQSTSIGQTIGIYNRSTDFYLEKHPNLLKLFIENKIKLSPHPVGYDLFAHKDNLYDWSQMMTDSDILKDLEISQDDSKVFQSFLLQSQPVQNLFQDFEQAWNERKKYFFKPSDSYGGKATYRGASISKKYFENAWSENFLAQAYFPPTKLKDNDGQSWKFDLRVYVYQDEVIYSLARVYQGQTTNFNTLGGGFAPVSFRA
jgi:hypothetical protein